MAHTPGPWAASKQKARRVTASGIVICNAVLRNRGGPKHKTYLKDEHEAEANAQLIAAAPDLLDAVQNLMGLFDTPVVRRRLKDDALYPEVIIQARAAVARAKGE